MRKTRAALTLALVAIMFLGGCSSSGSGPGGETTCAEWLALSLPLQEQLAKADPMSKEQEAIVKRMLSAHGKDTGLSNRTSAGLQIAQFCLISGNDSPIEDAINW